MVFVEVMEQRREEIVTFVNEHGQVTFNQLKERFASVSDMTLRTDLKVLDQNQRIIRIHGGAKSFDNVAGNDDYLKYRSILNTDLKKEIANKANELIHPNQTIFIDSGSSTTLLSQLIQDQNNVFFTSGLTCAVELAKLEKSKVSIVGGIINSHSLSVHGVDAVEVLKNINFDIVFLGTTRFDFVTGFTCESLEDAYIKRAVVHRAKKVVVLMDSSKVNKSGTYTFCTLNDVSVVVSDSKLPMEIKDNIKNQGVMVL